MARSTAVWFAAALFALSFPDASLAQPSALDRSLVASWPLDGDARDAGARGHDGVVRGAQPAFDRFGRPGRALAFDGRGDHVGASVGPQPPRFTVAAWVLPSSVDEQQAVVSKLRDDPARLHRDFEVRLETGGKVTLQLPGPQGRGILASARPVRFGDWTHVAATFDGARALLYVDGVPQPGALVGRYTFAAGPLFIGARPGAAPRGQARGAPTHFFEGAIDDVQLFDRALSAHEVAALYEDAPRRPEPGRPVAIAPPPPAPAPARDDLDELRDDRSDLARLDRLVVRFDAACARRDADALRRVEEEASEELRREARESREEGDRRDGRHELRAMGDELSSLRGRLDRRSLGRKRALLVDLTERAWREMVRDMEDAEREGWSRR